MKRVTIDRLQPNLSTLRLSFRLIENQDDLNEYAEFSRKTAVKVMNKTIQSDIDIERFNHTIPNFACEEQSIMKHALALTTLRDVKNPIYHLESAVEVKLATLQKVLDSGTKILVNAAGGWNTFMKDDVVISIEEVEQQDEQTVFINENSNAIVLENDYVIPNESHNYIKTIDPNYAKILDLRGNMLNYEKFVDILKNQFNGEIVYVYTTAMDVEQMHKYCDAIIEAKIPFLVVHITVPNNKLIQEWYTKYRGKFSIEVEFNVK